MHNNRRRVAYAMGLMLLWAVAGCTRKVEMRKPVANDDPPVQVHDGSLHFATNDAMWLVPNNGASTVTPAGFVDGNGKPASVPADWTEVDVCDSYNASSTPACSNGIVVKPYPTASPAFFLVNLSDADYPSADTANYKNHRYTDHELVDSSGNHSFWPNVLVVTGTLEGTTAYNCPNKNSDTCKVNFGPTY